MWRSDVTVSIVILTEREVDMAAADIPLGERDLSRTRAPVRGQPNSQSVPLRIFEAGRPLSASNLARANSLLMLCPMPQDANSGFVVWATDRSASPVWFGLERSDSTLGPQRATRAHNHVHFAESLGAQRPSRRDAHLRVHFDRLPL